MPNWAIGLTIIVLFLIVRRVFNPKPKKVRTKRRTVESICRKMKIPVDDKSAYCLLCHCVVGLKEAEPEKLRRTPVPPKTAYQKALDTSGVEQWDTTPQHDTRRPARKKKTDGTDYSE